MQLVAEFERLLASRNGLGKELGRQLLESVKVQVTSWLYVWWNRAVERRF